MLRQMIKMVNMFDNHQSWFNDSICHNCLLPPSFGEWICIVVSSRHNVEACSTVPQMVWLSFKHCFCISEITLVSYLVHSTHTGRLKLSMMMMREGPSCLVVVPGQATVASVHRFESYLCQRVSTNINSQYTFICNAIRPSIRSL